MYRILRNSITNFCDSLEYDEEDVRYKDILFIKLLIDEELYNKEKSTLSERYKILSSFLYKLKDDPRFELMIHEFNLMGIEPKEFLNDFDFSEASKLFSMFLDLAYWKDYAI